jgi:hypothetical protein
MELDVHKTKVIYFTHKAKSIHFNYYASDVSVLHTDCIKDLKLGSKLHFHCHMDYIHSQALRIL